MTGQKTDFQNVWRVCLEKNADGTRTAEARLALRMLRRKSPDEVADHFVLPFSMAESVSREVQR
ncbi:hypothetical protein LptCag_1586 [Leptospirillum ferriphilum]|uniref:Uncharacterized protein n=1 Tax=Leptospirillum ferriphilum TaxID=178606 RepID=A0A094YKX0_9BACT|nr:hypothetical protein [Leptospirillum ferriphilum]KGA93876.1 hypothetical protein LptCag_1586 [Leptospirillum ferriphilum]